MNVQRGNKEITVRLGQLRVHLDWIAGWSRPYISVMRIRERHILWFRRINRSARGEKP